MRAVRVAAVLAAILLTATACDGGRDDPGDEPTNDSSETGATAPAGIPDVVAGRLTRILGNGGTEALRDTAYVPGTRLSEPVLVATGPDGELIGLQRRQEGLFTVSPDGTVQPVSGDASVAFPDAPLAALVGTEALLVLTGTDGGTIGRVGLADGAFSALTTLPGGPADGFAGAILDLPGGTYVQWGASWWTLTGPADAPTGAEPATPPVDGSVVAARTAAGVAVLTAGELVLLDESLQETGRYPWTQPDEAIGSVTAATGDGGDGLIVTTSEREGGSVVHVTADGATVLATGFKPDDTTPSTDCDNADTEALHAHLAQPLSVAVWEGRVVVADQRCNSVLQLGLPAVS
ncbi:hypothetical protein E1212_11050 [Jiangella ureilytica]|uniref:Uncharacterized protein n=1 Tax=Jiangella ureilytica TaxID=2530374 RepID=A0A4R4RTC1_9ACTN|nr:hypothetical protein [Jiangella ureilytica]TDC51733.1 hypothetical protein E1212_11050 [Jiangella ureilytica]